MQLPVSLCSSPPSKLKGCLDPLTEQAAVPFSVGSESVSLLSGEGSNGFAVVDSFFPRKSGAFGVCSENMGMLLLLRNSICSRQR